MVVKLHSDDLDMREVHDLFVESGISEEQCKLSKLRELAKNRGNVISAYSENELIGAAFVSCDGVNAWLTMYAVKESYRNHRVFSQMYHLFTERYKTFNKYVLKTDSPSEVPRSYALVEND